MSASLLAYLQSLFGRDERADCTIAFYHRSETEADELVQQSKRQRTDPSRASHRVLDKRDTLGDPLPAHTFILNPGSAYFSAQAERWTEQPAPGVKPYLHVPLDCAEDLPHALAAIRYIYTGRLEDVHGAEPLLHVRRLASYLQVQGCMEACDKALLGLINGEDNSGAATVEKSIMAGVSELFACRHLLPGGDDDPGAEALLEGVYRACRERLVRHFQSGGAVAMRGAGQGNSTGDLLGWAFRDAPSLLSDPTLKRQMQSLPAAALEALLGSATFATDNEASVLLVLAEWLQLNAVLDTTRGRLCKLIRVIQLSPAYLHTVLPELSWFPISPKEHRFLCQYATADAGTRQLLKDAILDGGLQMVVNLDSVWYSAPARPHARSDAGRAYEWSVELKTHGSFVSNRGALVGNGFVWRPWVYYTETGRAKIYLSCYLPDALHITRTEQLLFAAEPGAANLVLRRWTEGGGKEVACSFAFKGLHVMFKRGRGCSVSLAPAADTGSTATDPLAPWVGYLRNGHVSGTLTWEA